MVLPIGMLFMELTFLLTKNTAKKYHNIDFLHLLLFAQQKVYILVLKF